MQLLYGYAADIDWLVRVLLDRWKELAFSKQIVMNAEKRKKKKREQVLWNNNTLFF